jgi:16S rRNA (adenine1518-N6/adenine1519-N6)-dimethyltransferase
VNGQSRTEILSLLERHGVTPRKAYGQHFLADPNLIAKVVSVAEVGASDSVVEVGAGTGTLTAALAATGATLVAYEVDERLRPLLAESLAGREVDLRFADVMQVDFDTELGPGDWKLVANLPYNVGTPLLLDILLRTERIRWLTVMVQREVADRLVASPGTAAYGVPSVVVSLTSVLVERFPVPPQVFVPAPSVASVGLRLDRRPAPARLEEAVSLARTAFGQRRKMLRRSLRGRVDEQVFAHLGLADTVRPEELTPAQFVALAEEAGRG